MAILMKPGTQVPGGQLFSCEAVHTPGHALRPFSLSPWGFWTLNCALFEVEALSPMRLLQAATLKHPCDSDPVWLTGKGSQDTSPTSEVKVKCRCPEERPRGESKILVIVSLYLCRLQGQDGKHSTSGSLPTGWLWGLPQEEPPPSAPSGPPGGPFAPSSRTGAHRAQEEGIKDPVEGAEAPPDSQHQDGTSRLWRPGKTTPLPHHGGPMRSGEASL